jgi:hypothetical protein
LMLPCSYRNCFAQHLFARPPREVTGRQ